MSQHCTRYSNGLLDLAIVSPELENITKRIASSSPLLRLPGELRNHIWSHVLSSISIEISIRDDQDTSSTSSVLHSRHISPIGTYSHSPSPFLLPLVCHASYTELSFLLYQHTRFCFDFALPTADPRTVEILAEQLLPYQREAVTTIEPYFHILHHHYLHAPQPLLRHTFPSLKRVVVSTLIGQCEALGFVPGRTLGKGEAESIVAAKIREMEDGDLEVVWAEFRVLREKGQKRRGHCECGMDLLLATVNRVYEANPV
jgi:hypothetical protein